MTFKDITYYLADALVVLAGVSGLLRFRYLPLNLRYLAFLTFFELPLEMLGVVLKLLNHNNLFIMPIYMIGELALLGLVYQHTLRIPTFAKALPWVIGGFTAYVGLDTVLGPGLQGFRPGQQVLQSLLILSMVGFYFRQLLNELQIKHLEREPMFWVSVGLIVYFLGYLQLALFSSYLLNHYSLQFNRSIWTIHALLGVFLHFCYALALWMRPQR